MPAFDFIDSFVKMPLVRLPVRTVILTVATGKVVYSPGSQLTEAELKAVPEVTDLVAPSLYHLGGMPQAVRAHPGARVWGPKGCREKRPDIAWTHLLGEDAWPHSEALPLFEIRGMPRLNEVALVHRETKTLVVADLVFNVEHASGLGARIIYGLFGTFRRFAVSRLYLREVTDPIAFRDSLRALLTEHFDRVQPSHGALLTKEGKILLAEALRERGIEV